MYREYKIKRIVIILLITFYPTKKFSLEIQSEQGKTQKVDRYNEFGIGAFNLVAFGALDLT